MQTSQQWWESTKADPEKLIKWLKDQYHGEVTAANRILVVFGQFDLTEQQQSIISRIAKEEAIHAVWVGDLLLARGVKPETLRKQERYWDKTLKGIDSLASAAAVAHHAEHMRLERIDVIARDSLAPRDIREVFKKIFVMEENHERWFEELATPEAIKAAKGNHELGRKALGLVS